MERTIGNLIEEIRSHLYPYVNLSQRGLERCQVNALKAMFPDLEEPENLVLRGTKDLGNGFVLLRAREATARYITDPECQALKSYLQDTYGIDTPSNWSPKISRWARLRLPNGQVAWSAWKEKIRPLKKVWMVQNVTVRSLSVPLIYHLIKFYIQIRKPKTNHDIFVEVQYYFCLQLEDDMEVTLAMVSCFSSPDKTLIDTSYNTLRSCTYLDQGGLMVIDVKYINSVIAMVPHQPFDGDSVQRYFVVEKPGLDIACLGGAEEQVPENE